jgi:hypothetical protein
MLCLLSTLGLGMTLGSPYSSTPHKYRDSGFWLGIVIVMTAALIMIGVCLAKYL